jgi:hypothetical protein
MEMKISMTTGIMTIMLLSTLVSYGQTNSLPASGNIGIGTTSPSAPLHISRGTATNAYPTSTSVGNVMNLYTYGNNGMEIGIAAETNARRMWILARHRTVATYGQHYGSLHLQPDVGNKTYFRGVGIGFAAETALPIGTHLAVNGKVGIGVSSPKEMLEVKGKIKTQEVNVTAAGWADYVFQSDYRLMPLSELADFIQEKGHLPNVPTTVEVMENGVNLAEMNVILLEKVEELTLYILRQEKMIQELNAKIGDY